MPIPVSPTSADAIVDRLVTQVREAIRRNDAPAAERLCVEILAHQPHREDALSYLILRALHDGETARACALAEQGLAGAPGSAQLHFHHGNALHTAGELEAAWTAFDRAYTCNPHMLIALLYRGEIEGALGRNDATMTTSVQALQQASKSGLLHSRGQLPPEFDARLSAAMVRVRAARGAALDEVLDPLRRRHGAAALDRVQRALDVHLDGVQPTWPHPLQRPTFLLIPDLTPQAWFEREEFPFLGVIEAATSVIREELLAVLADGAGLTPYVDMPANAPAAGHWRELNRSPRWSAYHLYRHGVRVHAHCARCPRTVALLDSLPILRLPEHAPEALFSVLEPNTHIPPHTGVINGRLTVHLPLIVPENCGALVVGGEARVWEPGRCLVFDDSFVHEALNHSAETRVVLIFDLWNPQLRAAEREALGESIAAIGRFNRRFGGDSPMQQAV